MFIINIRTVCLLLFTPGVYYTVIMMFMCGVCCFHPYIIGNLVEM